MCQADRITTTPRAPLIFYNLLNNNRLHLYISDSMRWHGSCFSLVYPPPTDTGMKMDNKLKARSRLEIRAKPLRGWLFWGGWLVLGLSLMIFLMVGALIGTAGGMVYSGGSMALGLVLVGTLLAMDAVIA